MLQDCKIVIIGGEPAGLMTASLLHRRGIPFIVLESDRDRDARRQGGTLDLHGLATPERQRYSGVSVLDIWTYHVEPKKPKLSALVGQGMFLSPGHGRLLCAQRDGDDSIRTYAFLHVPEDWAELSSAPVQEPVKSKQHFADVEFSEWRDDLKNALLRDSDDDVTLRKLYMLPVGLRWASVPGIALVGDAAHLMTIFAGVGVNVALEDALQLTNRFSDVITVENGGSGESVAKCDPRRLAEALKAYDEDMFARAERNATVTWQNKERYMADNGVDETIKLKGKMLEAGKTVD